MPGAGKQAPEVQAQIKELLEAGFDPTTIHRKLKVGRSSIYRMKRCLQQHGTAYMPTELNKKNGRPKVLAAEQELEVRDWLREPKNRNRYLDDLVWLIHDRFGIVCSTTTMSKLKRKWMRVIEAEETGQPLDDSIHAQVMETHPNLPILRGGSAPPAQMVQASPGATSQPSQPAQPAQPETDPQPPLPQHRPYHSPLHQRPQPREAQMDPQLLSQQPQQPITDPKMQLPYYAAMPSYPQHIDSQLEQQLQRGIASTEATRAV